MREAGEDDGAGCSEHVLVDCDRESSVCRTELSLELRGSGAVNTVAANGDPSFAGPTSSSKKRTPWDEWVSRRQYGIEAGSRGDGPVGETTVSCEPQPLVVVIVETSHRLAMSEVSAIVSR